MAVTMKRILDEIGCPHLRLYRDKRSSYFYFVYDTPGVWESKSVYVAYLDRLPLSQWVADGRELVKACEAQAERAARAGPWRSMIKAEVRP